MVIIIFSLFFLASFVYGAKLNVIDFSKDSEQIVVMNERDAVKFNFTVRDYHKPVINSDGNEEILFDKLTNEEIIKLEKVGTDRVDLTIFIEGAETPQYVTLANNTQMKLDFERDFIDDLSIGLVSIKDKQVSLVFNVLDRTGNPDLRIIGKRKGWYAEEAVNETSSGTNVPSWYENWKIWVIVVLVILVLFFNRRFIRRTFRRVGRNLR